MKQRQLIFCIISVVVLLGCGNKQTERRGVQASPIWTSFLKHFGLESAALPEIGSTAAYEECSDIASDSSGNVYCAGQAGGNLAEASGGGDDAFVMKLNSAGSIQWITQIGSATAAASPHVTSAAQADYCKAVAVDDAGNVYCAGLTWSSLAEPNAGGGGDAFVMKLNSSGVIQWVTQIGATTDAAFPSIDATGADDCTELAVKSDGSKIYCAGSTSGSLAEANGGGADIFVMELSSSGSLNWIAQVGGPTATSSIHVNSAGGNQSAHGLALNSVGEIIVGGHTAGAFGEANAGNDAFVMKFSSVGAVEWVSHIGTATDAGTAIISSVAGSDICYSVALDSSDNIYCGGETYSSFAEANGGAGDAFVFKLNNAGVLQWAKQIGSVTAASSLIVNNVNGNESCTSIAVDSSSNIYCAGETGSIFTEANGQWAWDPLVFKMNSTGTLQWVKQFGSVTIPDPLYEGAVFSGVGIESSGHVYAAGNVYGNFTETNGGSSDGDIIVVRLKPDGTL